MTSTVVGVFDEYEDALAAREKLLDAGVDENSMQMSSARGEEGTEPEPQVDRRGFFARLFGLGEDDDRAGHYAEAVRRGSTALTVSLDDDAQVDMVGDILNDCGAIDVDERVEHWRAGGYTSFDPAAPVYGDEDIQRERERFRMPQEDLGTESGQAPGGGVRVHRRVSEIADDVIARGERAMAGGRRAMAGGERAMASGGAMGRGTRSYDGPERRTRVDPSYSGPERRTGV